MRPVRKEEESNVVPVLRIRVLILQMNLIHTEENIPTVYRKKEWDVQVSSLTWVTETTVSHLHSTLEAHLYFFTSLIDSGRKPRLIQPYCAWHSASHCPSFRHPKHDKYLLKEETDISKSVSELSLTQKICSNLDRSEIALNLESLQVTRLLQILLWLQKQMPPRKPRHTPWTKGLGKQSTATEIFILMLYNSFFAVEGSWEN